VKRIFSKISEMVFDKPQYWLVISVNVLFFLLMIILLSYQGYSLYSLIKTSSDSENNSNTITTGMQSIATKDVSISKWHIFGIKNNMPGDEANTKWTLKGVIIGNDKKSNLAIISSTDTDEAVYQSGAKLSSGETIQNIFPDRVLISNHDVTITLFIPWEMKSKLASSIKPSNTVVQVGSPFSNMKEP
jgi:type II secretory pathway component PulC